jgi:hypothetical protein
MLMIAMEKMQIHSEVDSHIYESTLDNADDFFMQVLL